MKKRFLYGMSILELLMAMTLFSMLAGLVFYFFTVSSKSWLKVRTGVEIKESAQITLSRIEREIRASSINSVQLDSTHPNDGSSNAISFLSAFDPNTGMTVAANNGAMKWKKYILFYLKDDLNVAANGYYQLFSKEVSIGVYDDPNDPNVIFDSCTINKLPYMPDGSGGTKEYKYTDWFIEHAADTYISQERSITRNITMLHFDIDYTRGAVVINIKTGKPVNAKDTASVPSNEKLELRGLVILRNP